MKEKTKFTFENVPEVTYWRNPNSGVIYHCSIHRNTWVECDEFEEGGYDYDTSSKNINISSINTRVEYNYYYTWEELVEKFEFLCTSDDVDEDFYVNILSNRTLYREYKLSKSRLPYLRRALKREPDAGHDVELEKMLSYVEKYNNLESFEFWALPHWRMLRYRKRRQLSTCHQQPEYRECLADPRCLSSHLAPHRQ